MPNTSTVHRFELPHQVDSVSTCRPASPAVVATQSTVVSSSTSVHVMRILSLVHNASQAVRPPSVIPVPAVLSSRPSIVSITAPSSAGRFRPPISTVTSFQAAFNRASFSSTAGSSLRQLLLPSAAPAAHLARSRMPFSNSSPNLVATGSKHVLIDSSTGHVITTVLPPAGNGRRLDDGILRKNSSVASAVTSVSVARVIVSGIFACDYSLRVSYSVVGTEKYCVMLKLLNRRVHDVKRFVVFYCFHSLR